MFFAPQEDSSNLSLFRSSCWTTMAMRAPSKSCLPPHHQARLASATLLSTTVNMLPSNLTPSQALALLSRHARDEITPLHLRELCRDNDRVSSLVSVHNTSMKTENSGKINIPRSLILDISRQRMTLETVGHLMKFANSRNIRKFLTRMSWGQNCKENPVVPRRAQIPNYRHVSMEENDAAAKNNKNSNSTTADKIPTEQDIFPSMHMTLRVPSDEGYEMLLQDGTNALHVIHAEWERIERISESIRKATFRGASGGMIRDVIVVGRGVAVSALRFIYSALLRDEKAAQASKAGMMLEMTTARLKRNISGILHSSEAEARRLRFVSSVDPVAIAEEISDLDPASTLVISIALEGNEDTGLATKTLKTWLLQALGSTKKPDLVLSQHMMLVTANEKISSVINKPENVFLLPKHCRWEGFSTCTSASLLPLSIIFGWSIVKEFLMGAHDIDVHCVESSPRHNLPLLLALSDIWNAILLHSSTRYVIPFASALDQYPRFTATIESETCGGNVDDRSDFEPFRLQGSVAVIDGGNSSSYDRALFQTSNVSNVEFVCPLNFQLSHNASKILGAQNNQSSKQIQDALICSLFAHADELAVGSLPEHSPEREWISQGNRPCTLIFCDKVDAFACGQLVALAEHRSIIKAHLLKLDPFASNHGSTIPSQRSEWMFSILDELLVDDDDDNVSKTGNGQMNLSTRTILSHYLSGSRG